MDHPALIAHVPKLALGYDGRWLHACWPRTIERAETEDVPNPHVRGGFET